MAANVTDLADYKELIRLEQFLKGIPNDTRNYLNEREVTILQRTAHLDENFSLIFSQSRFKQPKQSKGTPGSSTPGKFTTTLNVAESTCYICKKPEHFKYNCPSKSQKKTDNSNSTSLAMLEVKLGDCIINAADVRQSDRTSVSEEIKKCDKAFEPFMLDGKVSMSDSLLSSTPVRIMRDTASSHNLIVRSSFPDVGNVLTGEWMLIQGIGGILRVPLCRLFLDCGIVSSYVTVGVGDLLPIADVDFLLGNDLAGCKVILDPIVVDVLLSVSLVAVLEKNDPNLLPSCVVERAKYGLLSTETGKVNCRSDSDVKNVLGGSEEESLAGTGNSYAGESNECNVGALDCDSAIEDIGSL